MRKNPLILWSLLLLGALITGAGAQQPDLWIKRRVLVGDNLYNRDAAGQTSYRTVEAGATVHYRALLENDGDETATFLIKGPAHSGGDQNWTVRYYWGWVVRDHREVTDQVTSEQGWKRANVPPGGVRKFLITVTPHSGVASGQQRGARVRARAKRDRNQIDTVKAIARVK